MKNVIKNIIFQSGSEVGSEISCYNCGKKFRDSLKKSDIKSGSVSVVCSCGGRIAYIKG